MFFGFGNFFLVIILVINAIAILSEDRFLARLGWGRTQDPGFGAASQESGVKTQAINLINSVRTVMRVPLIVINTIIILYLLALG